MANRPPSSCTIGRSSGGRTGSWVRTIHSGLLPDFTKASITLRRLIAFLRRWPDVVRTSSWRPFRRPSREDVDRISRAASAPIPARNTSPKRSRSSRYRDSVSKSRIAIPFNSSILAPISSSTAVRSSVKRSSTAITWDSTGCAARIARSASSSSAICFLVFLRGFRTFLGFSSSPSSSTSATTSSSGSSGAAARITPIASSAAASIRVVSAVK